MSTAKLFPRATTRSDTRTSACVTIYMHFGNTSPEVKTRVPGRSVQRSLRIWYQNYTACGWMCAPNRPGHTAGIRNKPRLRCTERAVEYLNITSPVIGLGLRDTGAWHVPSTSRCYGVCPNYVRRNVRCAEKCGFCNADVGQRVLGLN